ncbi:hypothetical protein TRIP_B350537 [uncultured Desulfatiglans sp.]|nr:hypothetical protein TRIP_B350537 [uncultured Desulfatiglans sp.]
MSLSECFHAVLKAYHIANNMNFRIKSSFKKDREVHKSHRSKRISGGDASCTGNEMRNGCSRLQRGY